MCLFKLCKVCFSSGWPWRWPVKAETCRNVRLLNLKRLDKLDGHFILIAIIIIFVIAVSILNVFI
jgi:hypothetical protein